MDAIEAILNRRSVRSFQKKAISQDIQKTLLECAMHAPSAMNQQPWQFILIEDATTLSKISLIHPHAEMTSEAALAVVVCGDMRLTKTDDFWIQDCSAATQNLMVAAQAFGIGSVWAGIYPRDEIVKNFHKFLHLPKEVIPFSLIVLGYPDREPQKVERFHKERVHINQW